MKKFLALLLAFAVTLACMAGCGGNKNDTADTGSAAETQTTDALLPPPSEADGDNGDDTSKTENQNPNHRPTVNDDVFPIGFESGGAEGFAPRGEETVTVSDSFAFEGEYSLFVTDRTSSWNGPSLDVTAYVQPMTDYEFSCWVYIPEAEEQTLFMLSAQTDFSGASNYKQLTGEAASQIVGPGTWTELRGVVVFDGYDAAHIYIETGNNPQGSFYIDNAALYRVGDMQNAVKEDLPSLKDVYADYFLIGTAGEVNLFNEDSLSLHVISTHFNAMTAENSMKPASLQNRKGEFTFAGADALVAAVKQQGMTMIGHTLGWHQQSPAWMNSEGISRDEAIENLQTHIKEVVTHFGDDVYAWDVLNEIFDDSITDPSDWRGALRDSPWLNAIGPDYVEIAFKAARDANPNILLYYNDYNLDNASKREAVYHMAEEFIRTGVPIDGIGMQGHYSTSTSIAAVERSLERFSELGIKVSITELDVMYNNAGSELTPEQEVEQAIKYAELFQLFKQYSDVIERVTFWGVSDGASWRADRFPLLFDRYYMAKEAFYAVLDPDYYLANNEINRELPDSKTAVAVYGSPVIGGAPEQWDAAEAIPVDTPIMAWEGATGEARVMWDETGLYILFTVKDPVLNDSARDTYAQDSVEIFIDENNAKSDSYQSDDFQVRVNYNNLVSFNPNEIPKNGEVKSDAKTGGGGYTIQLFYPFQTITGAAGTVIGFDLQINDSDDRGRRNVITKWNDLTDDSWRSTLGFGNLRLE